MVGRVGVSSTESKSGGGGSGGSGPSMLSSSSSNFGGFGSGLRVASSGGALFSDDLEEDKSSKEYEMIWSYVDYCFFVVVYKYSNNTIYFCRHYCQVIIARFFINKP